MIRRTFSSESHRYALCKRLAAMTLVQDTLHKKHHTLINRECCVGGYQVCHKWLKDRKGRTLSFEDIRHYQRIVSALGETIQMMEQINGVIEEHRGWPLA